MACEVKYTRQITVYRWVGPGAKYLNWTLAVQHTKSALNVQSCIRYSKEEKKFVFALRTGLRLESCKSETFQNIIFPIFKIDHSWHLFSLIFFFSKQWINSSIKIDDDRIHTRVFWCRRRPICQLCHNQCPVLPSFSGACFQFFFFLFDNFSL